MTITTFTKTVPSGLLFTIIYLLFIFSRNVTCDDSESTYFDCRNSNYTYSLGSTFQENLNFTLFNVLPSNASLSRTLFRFSNFSIGEGIDRVYALYLCRGDIDAQACHDCVQAAATTVIQRCRLLKEGIVWYQNCMLRYANRTIFSSEESNPMRLGYNHSTNLWSTLYLDPFTQQIGDAMDELVEKVAFNLSLYGYATTQIELHSSETWRGLAQCTPDILGSPCQACLRDGLKQRDTWANNMIFLPSCFIRFDLYGSPSTITPSPGTKKSNIIRIVLPCAIAVLLLLAGGFLLWKTYCHPRRKQSNIDPLAPLPTHLGGEEETSVEVDIEEPRPAGLKRFSFNDVENMTSDFHSRLGEGGFGYVYHGHFGDGNRLKEVAVKVLSKDAPKQFSTEIAVFGKIAHKNLVSLIGYCEEPDHLALVYEYMAGGDLKVLLQSGSVCLNWKTRLQIAIDSAQGLDYLHTGCKPAIVHRDVKTPNILLNQDLRAKIADFGFSKIFPEKSVSVLSTRVIGTPGYVDPQYHLTGQLNERSDVYSFGVVLLELITGKGAIVTRDANLVQWVRPTLEKGDLERIVDPKLKELQNRSSLWRATDLAMECVRLNGAERPTMSQVVTELKECLAMEVGERSPRVGPNSMEMITLSFSAVMGPSAR